MPNGSGSLVLASRFWPHRKHEAIHRVAWVLDSTFQSFAEKFGKLVQKADSVGKVDTCFDFKVVNRVVLDNRHAPFERCDPTIVQHSTYQRIERKKQAPSLSRHTIAEIHANVGVRIKREEPAIGKVEVQSRRYLQIADFAPRWISCHTQVIAQSGTK